MKISIAGVMSINRPTTSNVMLIKSRMTYLLSEMAIKASPTASGMLAKVIDQLIRPEQAIQNKITAEPKAECNKMLPRRFKVKVR